MKVWIKYKETVSSVEIDYELVDLDVLIYEYVPSENLNEGYSYTNVGDAVVRYLNEQGAMLYGDRWFGATWDWTLVDKPPVEYFQERMKYANARVLEYQAELSQYAQEKVDYYPKDGYFP